MRHSALLLSLLLVLLLAPPVWAQDRFDSLALDEDSLPEGFVFEEPDEIQRRDQGLTENPMTVTGQKALKAFIRRPAEQRLYGHPEALDRLHIAIANPRGETERVLIQIVFDLADARMAEWIARNTEKEFGPDCKATLLEDDLLVVIVGSGVSESYLSDHIQGLEEAGLEPIEPGHFNRSGEAVSFDDLLLGDRVEGWFAPLPVTEPMKESGLARNPFTATKSEDVKELAALAGMKELLGDGPLPQKLHFALYASVREPGGGFSYVVVQFEDADRTAEVLKNIEEIREMDEEAGPFLFRSRGKIAIVGGFSPEEASSFFWLSRQVDEMLGNE